MEEAKRKKYYFSNRDLLVIAILSGIGGVMSTYVGYLGNLLNRVFGVPFGAGQFVSGLHIFWFILAAGLIRKPGTATTAGLLKGVIEMLTGSTHGIAIILVSLMQGLMVDLVLLVVRRHNLASYILAGGIAAASNVFVFQLLYFSHAPFNYLLFISLIAFVSGVLLAGSFGHSVLEIVIQARPFHISDANEEGMIGEIAPASDTRRKKKAFTFRMAATILLAGLLSLGAVYYYAAVFEPPWTGPRCQVQGMVETPLSFQLSHFSGYETTVTAELIGKISHVPPQEYTGIPVHVIIEEARPEAGARKIHIIAADGYEVEFDLKAVLNDGQMLLIQEEDSLRLIAGSYGGEYWVRQVSRIVVQ